MQIQVLNDAEIKALNFVDLERIDYETYEVDQSSVMEFARDIESAILVKLASAELPEPAMKETNPHLNSGHDPYNGLANLQWFTAAQLHEAHAQGFAAGAASQLAQEPLCYVRNGEINRWNGLSGMGFSGPLYTRREAK